MRACDQNTSCYFFILSYEIRIYISLTTEHTNVNVCCIKVLDVFAEMLVQQARNQTVKHPDSSLAQLPQHPANKQTKKLIIKAVWKYLLRCIGQYKILLGVEVYPDSSLHQLPQ